MKILDTPTISIVLYRIANFLYKKNIKYLPRVISIFSKLMFSIEISYTAEIGKNFKIFHGVGVVIGGKVKIEDEVTLNQGVTIGGNFNKSRMDGDSKITQPVLKKGCHICAGAKVLGPVIVGESSIVGANSVVTRDVKDNVIVAGIPATVIKERSNDK